MVFLSSQRSLNVGRNVGRIQRLRARRQLNNRVKRIGARGMTMTADMVQRQTRRERSASVSSVHSRLGVRRNSNAGNNPRRLKRSNSRGRSLTRANSQQNLSRSNSQRNLSRANSQRNLSRANSQRNLSRANSQRNLSQNGLRRANSVSNLKKRSNSRQRFNNVGQRRRIFQNSLKRSNSRLNVQARLGINKQMNPINARRNNRRAIGLKGRGGRIAGANNNANRQVDVT